MQPIRQAFTVTYRYALYPTHGVFAAANPLLRDVLAEAGEAPVKALVAIDAGVLAARPTLVGEIEADAAAHAGGLALAAAPLVLAGGEAAKNDPEALSRLHAAIDDVGLCRHGVVVAVGGGAFLDLAGFAAATAHRGVRLVRVPTTVLAQNDAGVGVKNGVNAFGKKNFLGAFAPPWAIINDAAFLPLLGARDWRAGTAEAVKVALLKDPAFFAWLEARAGDLVARDLPAMAELVHRCAALHMAHIATGGDPFEAGSSRPLDLGHWAAHKLEQLTRHALRHGEAVAIGLALDATYALLVGLLAPDAHARILALLERLGFTLWVPELEAGLDHPDGPDSLLAGLREFREHLGGRLTIPLIERIGHAVDVHAIDPDLVRAGVARLRARHDHTKGDAPWASETVAVR